MGRRGTWIAAGLAWCLGLRAGAQEPAGPPASPAALPAFPAAVVPVERPVPWAAPTVAVHVRDAVSRQAVTAAGSGCMAGLEAQRWL